MKQRKVMLIIAAVFAVLGLAALAGCGGGGTTTVTVTTSASDEPAETEEVADERGAESESEVEAELEEIHAKTAEAEHASEEEAEEGTCNALGINSEQLKEGRCEQEGQTLVVVNHDSPMKMKSMKVKLLGVSKAKTLSSDLGSETASGTYVTFKLEVTNLTHAPAEWENEQSFLYLNESEYSEDFEVQNGTEQESLQWEASESVQPGNSIVGTVTFDVPNKVLKNLYSEGNLDFKNLGEAGYYNEEPAELGIIRTYN